MRIYLIHNRSEMRAATTATSSSNDSSDSADVTDSRINVNTASVDQLTELPGIGPSLAAKIIEYRTAHGAFTQLSDLDNVSGIGPSLLEKVKDLVVF